MRLRVRACICVFHGWILLIRQIHELEICRAKLTAQQKLLSSNAHPGQTQRVAVLEKRFRSELRKIQREAEWRNVASGLFESLVAR